MVIAVCDLRSLEYIAGRGVLAVDRIVVSAAARQWTVHVKFFEVYLGY